MKQRKMADLPRNNEIGGLAQVILKHLVHEHTKTLAAKTLPSFKCVQIYETPCACSYQNCLQAYVRQIQVTICAHRHTSAGYFKHRTDNHQSGYQNTGLAKLGSTIHTFFLLVVTSIIP